MKRKYKIVPVIPEDKIRMDMERPSEQRILMLLRLIRYSSLVAEAGAKYRKTR